jgi:predicted Fe-Mo cluster-binding NifX family protein
MPMVRRNLVRVGIPIWGDRVSPVLDTAESLLVVDGGAVAEARTVRLEGRDVQQRAREIGEVGLDVLVCGAVSRPLSLALAAVGVRVVAWISGQVEDVLRAYQAGELGRPRYLMPGCRRRGGPGPRGRRHGRARHRERRRR